MANGEYRPINDYAAIGDGHTVALVSRTGSIDWWCPGRFDSPSVFGALLDPEVGGKFRVGPTAQGSVERRYVGDTNVLETTFTTDDGQVRVTDVMPMGSANGFLRPQGSIVRVIECTRGEVEVEAAFEPRFDYGRVVPRIRQTGSHAFVCAHGADALALRTEIPFDRPASGAALHARTQLQQGERRTLAVAFARGEPLVLPPLGDEATQLVDTTLRWWSHWADVCTYAGPYREAVVRSALALKLLIYGPSGAIIAAPTTSLPEEIGGQRNYDYRYCWLRDASLCMRALMGLGYKDEGAAYFGWLTHATNLTWPHLRVLYDVFGGSRLEERELEHLAGYRGSRPVRVGNGAADQLQLDVYGEVVGAAYTFVSGGGALGRRNMKRLVELGKTVCERWQEPDSGIWEIRSGPAHHVYSKAMCWCVLDKLIRMHEQGHLHAPVEQFRAVLDAIREAVERDGYNAELHSYVQAFGSCVPDASLLLLPAQGYVEAGAPRMRSTYAYLERGLSRNSLWYRYPPDTDDGLPGREGAFGACAFWAAEYLASRGDLSAATQTFEQALACANDVGLFAEETDPESCAALGNVPQAFTHVGLISAALAITKHSEG